MSKEEINQALRLLSAANGNSCGNIAAAQTQAIASFLSTQKGK